MKTKILFFSLVFVLVVFLFSFSSAVVSLSTPSVCCEKTLSGGSCINTEESQCNTAFKIVPTSCESTSFCQLGTCYDSKEGLCLENVPQKVCQESNGTWSEKKANELAQCQLGCCVLGDQAAFTTLTRCKSLSTFYGLNTNYKPEISSEFACINEANSQDEGACVSQQGGVRTCTFTTRVECGGTESTILLNNNPLEDFSGKRFYKDVLCSAEELGTVNARQTTTGCYKGKVYWFDSEGQKENIYSSDKDTSWNDGRVANPDDICAEVGESKTCGNCDYLLGSRCSEYTNILGIGKPTGSDFYCKATTCTDRDGNKRKNGESWCVYDGEVGNGRDPAGSRHYREICSDGEVQVEPCEDFRNQICIHSGIDTSEGEFSVSACRVNRWQDCTSQTKKDTCENTDARDCIWVAAVDGVNFTSTQTNSSQQQFNDPGQTFSNPVSSASGSNTANLANAANSLVPLVSSGVYFPLTGFAINHVVGSGVGQWEENELNNKLRTNRTENQTGLCVPMVSPGSEFWKEGDTQAICSQASATCQVNVVREYEKDILTGQKKLKSVTVEENDCLEQTDTKGKQFKVKETWAVKVNALCSALGDCGADVNFNGVFTDKGYEWLYKNQSYFFTQSDVGKITSNKLGVGTGEVLKVDYIINEEYKLNQDDYVYIK